MSEKPVDKAKAWRKTWGTRHVWIVLGWFLMISSPVIGVIPGPGFIIVFPIGLAMVLKNSRFAKKQYLRLSRRFPEYGRWMDWALRRRKVKGRPPAPDIWADFKHMFRRDDTETKLD